MSLQPHSIFHFLEILSLNFYLTKHNELKETAYGSEIAYLEFV